MPLDLYLILEPLNCNTMSKRKLDPLKYSHWNFKLEDHHVEEPKGKSMTVPEQTHSIRDILEKFSQGINLGYVREAIFEEQSIDGIDYEHVARMDIFEQEELAREIANQRDLIEEELAEQRETTKGAANELDEKATQEDPQSSDKELNTNE